MEDKYEIKERILAFPVEGKRTHHIEINVISWYNKKPQLDIRRWDNGVVRPSKGVSFSEDEARFLLENWEVIRECISRMTQ